MDSLKRIQRMETVYQEATAAIADYEDALQSMKGQLEILAILRDYYTNGDWSADHAYEEAHPLPAEMTCGVLSEDGVYDLLTSVTRLGIDSMELGIDMVKM